jgi:hypothetical protein
VININVYTKAHRDSGDRHLCLVIPIGHFEGGGLCLLENGLVLELRNGDIAIFRSSEVTHFNLDYRGGGRPWFSRLTRSLHHGLGIKMDG